MKKKYRLLIIFVAVIAIISGATFSWFNYYQETSNQVLIAGDIYLKLDDETNAISLTTIFPESAEQARARNDNTLEFTVYGKNTTSKDIYYEIMLNPGNDENGKTRFDPEDLVFDLSLVEGNTETLLLDAVSYEDFNRHKIWVDRVVHGTDPEISRTYKLRMWLAKKVTVGVGNVTYNQSNFKDHYGSVKIAVEGLIAEKSFPLKYSYDSANKNFLLTIKNDYLIEEEGDSANDTIVVRITDPSNNLSFDYTDNNSNTLSDQTSLNLTYNFNQKQTINVTVGVDGIAQYGSDVKFQVLKNGNIVQEFIRTVYDENYGNTILGYITYNLDVPVTQPIYAGRENYITQLVDDPTFVGWSTTNGGDVEYEFGDVVSFTTNTTLYAVYRETSYEQIIKEVNTTTQINFGNVSSASNGQGLYILSGTENDTNPIYYYRGAVTDNNVIFGGFCWQMVRTTDTGGIKMIYNGVATGDGKTCENTAHNDRIITSSAFNTSGNSPAYVGYMYNQRYTYSSGAAASNSIFGKNVEWDGTNYLVIEDTAGSASANTTLDANHHYTCGTANTSSCSSVRYYYYNSGSSYYYITLTNGDTIEDALYKMTGNGSNETKTKNASYVLNTTDSKAKTEIENWFKTNLTNEVDASKINYQEYLEDTIYCNNRSYKTVGSSGTYTQSGWNPSGGSLSTYLDFGSNNRAYNSNWYSTTNIPSMECENVTDQFSVSNQEAKLKYPVGLLTADEIILAGAAGNSSTTNNTYYLYTGNYYWSLSPRTFNSGSGYAREFGVGSNGALNDYSVHVTYGLRPVVSLKYGTEFEDGGQGTPTNPYVVKID